MLAVPIMIRSMTGFGSATAELPDGAVSVELRSVNARHLKLSFRLPDGGERWEPVLRDLLSARVQRGHVELRIAVEEGPLGTPRLELDLDLARACLDALERLREELELAERPDLSLLLRYGDVLQEAPRPPVGGIDPATLAGVVADALDGLLEMREREGARLEADLRERIAALRAGVADVTELAPARLARERDRLSAAVAELTEGSPMDEDRLAREIAVIADKWDIGEEIVRTRAHLEAFEEYLDTPAAEPVGKRLSFLVQELLREINTMGAKANDPAITRCVIEMKNEVERLREQVENVE